MLNALEMIGFIAKAEEAINLITKAEGATSLVEEAEKLALSLEEELMRNWEEKELAEELLKAEKEDLSVEVYDDGYDDGYHDGYEDAKKEWVKKCKDSYGDAHFDGYQKGFDKGYNDAEYFTMKRLVYGMTPLDYYIQGRRVVVKWEEGVVTYTDCEEGENFSLIGGLALCFLKRFYSLAKENDDTGYFNTFFGELLE